MNQQTDVSQLLLELKSDANIPKQKRKFNSKLNQSMVNVLDLGLMTKKDNVLINTTNSSDKTNNKPTIKQYINNNTQKDVAKKERNETQLNPINNFDLKLLEIDRSETKNEAKISILNETDTTSSKSENKITTEAAKEIGENLADITVCKKKPIDKKKIKYIYNLDPKLKVIVDGIQRKKIDRLEAEYKIYKDLADEEIKNDKVRLAQAKLNNTFFESINDYRKKARNIHGQLKNLKNKKIDQREFEIKNNLDHDDLNEKKKRKQSGSSISSRMGNAALRVFNETDKIRYEWSNPAVLNEYPELQRLVDSNEKRIFNSRAEINEYFSIINSFNKCFYDHHFDDFFTKVHPEVDKNIFLKNKEKSFIKLIFKELVEDLNSQNGDLTDSLEINLLKSSLDGKNNIEKTAKKYLITDMTYKSDYPDFYEKMYKKYLGDRDETWQLWRDFDKMFLQSCNAKSLNKTMNKSMPQDEMMADE